MANATQTNAVIRTVLLGIASTMLYLLLYSFEEPLLTYSQQGGWFFLVLVVVIAFIFSFVHGAFVNHFWDILGVKEKPIKK